MPFLVIDNLNKSYSTNQILKNVSFDVAEGELFTILGPSGSGKTTVINCISGIISPDAGKIYLKGEDISSKPINQRNIGLVFQNYSLFSNLSVRANIDLALQAKIRKTIFDILKWKLVKRERFLFDNEIKDILMKVNLLDHINKFPSQLSGGEKQRVAIARALVQNPILLCLDEPLGALDKKLKFDIQKEIKNIQKELGKSFLYITHDQTEAFSLSDRIAVINKGEIVQIGTPKSLYEKPETHFIAEFIGDNNIFEIKHLEFKFGIYHFTTEKGTTFLYTKKDEEIPKLPFYICLRPEKIQIERQEQGNTINTIEAYILDILYLDGRTKITVKLKNEEELTIAINTLEEKFSKKDKVWLSYSDKNLVIIKK